MTSRAGSSATVAMALVTIAAPASDRLEALADVQARIQYAGYTRDANALRSARAELEAHAGSADHASLARYYLAHAEFRLAQLSIEAGPEAAAGRLDGCIEHAGDALEHESPLPEAHALIAVCQNMRAEFSPIKGVIDSRSAAGHLRRARELAPDDPRIELLAAMSRYRKSPAGDPEVAAGFDRALELFAREKPPRPGWPDWGLAEAHAYRGSLYLAEGDMMRARNELERALLIAPDYAWALELARSIRAPLE